MLKTATLQNIQNHKKTIIDFHPNVNIICGESNQGKSAIFRGFDIVFNNNPNRYERYKPWDGKKNIKSKINLKFDDGEVSRVRSNSVNEYNLKQDGNWLEQPLTAFGHNPPDQIVDFLNLTDYNFRDQENKYFFIHAPHSC